MDFLKEFPFMKYPQAMAAFMQYEHPSTLLDFRNVADPDKQRLVMICVAEHVSEALCDGLLRAERLIPKRKGEIGQYIPVPEAVEFWKVHADKTPEEILDLWRAALPQKP